MVMFTDNERQERHSMETNYIHLPGCLYFSREGARWLSTLDQIAQHNTDAGLIPQCSKVSFSLESTFRADSLVVVVQPPRAIAYINMYVHVTNPKHLQPSQCLDTKILHTLVGMGGATLGAAVPHPGKVTQISCKG